jgi:hypothetical protein
MWLQDFLPEEINNIRIMTFGYDTTLTGPNASNKTIVDHRRYLVAQLETVRCSSDVLLASLLPITWVLTRFRRSVRSSFLGTAWVAF